MTLHVFYTKKINIYLTMRDTSESGNIILYNEKKKK